MTMLSLLRNAHALPAAAITSVPTFVCCRQPHKVKGVIQSSFRHGGNGFKVGIWLIDSSNLANKTIFSVDGSIVLLRNSNGEVQLIAEPTQRVVAAAMHDSGNFFSPCETLTRLDSREPSDLPLEEQADLQQALKLQSRRLVGLQLLDVKKHHPHRALSTGSPIPSPTHSPSIFYQTFLFPLLHNSSTEPLLENG
ncbi:hypothetical protein KPL71_024196 [Citrus sinensis]|uniref:Uncharacterized protein n=1 Tax=Citrus sinensis TaxID=2711 RepID=A0ACB8IPN8_CITSI|nr:hypothetical protein KPL71_024196 [Citrus sinensis]